MLRRHLATLLLASAIAAPAAADEGSRYSEWSPEGAGSAGSSALEALAQELQELIDEADAARAADPRFLQDLRDRIAAHLADAQPRAALIRDDFADGDFTDDPSWSVASGDFAIDRLVGLRTIVPVAEPEKPLADDPLDAILDTGDELLDSGEELLESGGELLDSGADAVGDLLSGEKKIGDLLGGGEDEDEVEEDTGPEGPEPAEIVLDAAIPNAFALEMEMSSRLAGKDARFEIDLFQGTSEYAGYRLAYMAGGDPGLVLSRFGRRGVTAIGEHDKRLDLEDGQNHTVALVRESDGTMTASVDGTPLIRVKSSAFDDPFGGLALVNSGGDYGVRSIAVYDAR